VKILLRSILTFCFIFFNQFVFSAEFKTHQQFSESTLNAVVVHQEDMILVNMHDLAFTNEGLFLLIGSETMPVSCLFIQNGNYYLNRQDYQSHFGVWYCKHCGQGNTDGYTTCWNCKKSRY
jgi:hypothetical protein